MLSVSEKAMAPHSSTLAWKIPWTKEPGGPQSMGWQRVGHTWAKTLESPVDNKEIQPVHPKGDQSWVFIGRADVEAETPILWPHNVKS